MATIASNVFLGAGGTAKSESAPKSSSGDFMELVQGMIQGNTPGEQLPANLLQLLLTGDSAGIDGALGDGADGTDEDGSDEAAAAGMAALLAGLQQVPVAGAAASDSTDGSSIGAAGSQRGGVLQALLASQGLAGALGGAAGAGIGAGAADSGAAASPCDANNA